jgi:four helix bundle protein
LSAPFTVVNAAAPSGAVAVSDMSTTAPCGAAAPAAAATSAAVPSWLSSDEPEPQLDASKLHCYQVALELHSQCSSLVSPLTRVLRDQLERASLSVVLNIAEAGGRRSRRDKARFYGIARGSATEVAALLDVLGMRRLAPTAALRNGRRLAIRVIQMLSKIDKALLR